MISLVPQFKHAHFHINLMNGMDERLNMTIDLDECLRRKAESPFRTHCLRTICSVFNRVASVVLQLFVRLTVPCGLICSVPIA
uniref:Uncharacterized protein n=1 Tax=Trichuris muris TaxID=70415 RepID=A0A5S6QJC9_TRIMR